MKNIALLSGVIDVRAIWNQFWPTAMDFLIDLVIALVILLVGKYLIKFVVKAVSKIMEKANVERSVSGFVKSLLKIALFIVLIIVVAAVLGIPTASLIALLGSAGLAVGLALQGSLSNFAGGVLILVLRPFVVGDFIDTPMGTGTVTSIDIFYTKLNTPDNRVVIIPNGALSNSSIINVSKEPTRRIDLVIGAGYQDDINKVKALLQGIVDELGERSVQQPDIFVSNYASSAVEYTYRIWVKAEDYWTVRAEVMQRVKEVFDANGVTIPFNQLDVTIVNK